MLPGASGTVLHILRLKGVGFGLDEQAIRAAQQIPANRKKGRHTSLHHRHDRVNIQCLLNLGPKILEIYTELLYIAFTSINMFPGRYIAIVLLVILANFFSIFGQKQNSNARVEIKDSPLPNRFVDGKTIVDELVFSGLDEQVDGDEATVEQPLYESEVRQMLKSDWAEILPGDKLDLKKTEKIIKTFMSFFADLGYFSAKVTVFGEPETNNRVRLIVAVERGPRFRVWDIGFRGNRNFGDEELKATMRDCLGDNWGRYDKRYINYCAEKNVRALMYSRGYFQAKIVEVSRRFSTSGLWITIGVSEGIRYLYGEIRIKGAHALSESEISKMLGQKRGEIADGRALQELLYEKLERIYKENGYLDYNAEFDPEFIAPTGGRADGVVNVDLTIDEGRQFTVGKIEFTGVSMETQQRLLQNFTLKTKDIFDQTKFEADIEELNKTNEFLWIDRNRDVELRTDENRPVVYLTIQLKPGEEDK